MGLDVRSTAGPLIVLKQPGPGSPGALESSVWARLARHGEAITVIRVAEAEIGADLSSRLQSLLQACFPGYPGRSYFKLPPHFRYLAMTSSQGVAAQMGVEFRVIRVGDTVVRTFGVIDLCVRQSQRSRGLAGRLPLR